MKVKELIELLEGFDENEEVLFLPNNSYYPEDFSKQFSKDAYIRAFWGSDYHATVLFSGEQVGGLGSDDEDEEDDE